MKSISLYAISSGFEKGLFFLLIPILSIFASIDQIGELTLIITTLKLLNPIFNLNAPAAMIRFGTNSENIRNGLFISHLKLLITFLAVFALLSIASISIPTWIFFGLSLGICDSLISLVLAYFRSQDGEKEYLYITIIKFLSYLTPVVIRSYNNGTFNDLLEWMLYANIFTSSALALLVYFKTSQVKSTLTSFKNKKIREYISFSMSFYVHSLSQWLINSSDRYIIPLVLNKEVLGSYSIAYSYSMILLILNSAIGLYIPTQYTKDFSSWEKQGKRQPFMLKMIYLGLIINLCPPLFFLFNNHIFSFVPIIDSNTAYLSIFISSSFIFLISYHFFVNFLFYLGKGLLLTKITVTCGLINIIINLCFLKYFGIWTAAISTWLSYMIYFLFIRKSAMSILSTIESTRSDYLKPIFFALLSFILSISIFRLGSYFLR